MSQLFWNQFAQSVAKQLFAILAVFSAFFPCECTDGRRWLLHVCHCGGSYCGITSIHTWPTVKLLILSIGRLFSKILRNLKKFLEVMSMQYPFIKLTEYMNVIGVKHYFACLINFTFSGNTTFLYSLSLNMLRSAACWM